MIITSPLALTLCQQLQLQFKKKSTSIYKILPVGVKSSYSIKKMIVLYAIKMSPAEIIAYEGFI